MNTTGLDATVSVVLNATPERVFRALTSDEITRWWVRPAVFDTREWHGDVRVGGRWSGSGIARGNAYALEGEYLEVDAPKRLVHTWHPAGMPQAKTTVTYNVQSRADGTTLLEVIHSGMPTAEACEANRVGWETSLDALRTLLASGAGGSI